MTQPPIYGQAAQATGFNPAPVNTPEPPEPLNVDDPRTQNIEAQVAQLVEARLSEVEKKYQDRIDELQKSLTKATTIATLPEHSAGPGLEIAPTWSQYLQEKSRAGTLTNDDLRMAGMNVDG
jgi:hypothetical protein